MLSSWGGALWSKIEDTANAAVAEVMSLRRAPACVASAQHAPIPGPTVERPTSALSRLASGGVAFSVSFQVKQKKEIATKQTTAADEKLVRELFPGLPEGDSLIEVRELVSDSFGDEHAADLPG